MPPCFAALPSPGPRVRTAAQAREFHELVLGGGSTHVTFGPVSTARLLLENPRLLSVAVLWHLQKSLGLLARVQVQGLREVMDVVPSEVFAKLFPQILEDISDARMQEFLVPLLNDPSIRQGLCTSMQLLDPWLITRSVNEATLANFSALMSAPPDKLASLLRAVHPERMPNAVLETLKESEALLRDAFVPLLQDIKRPDFIGRLLNFAEPFVLTAVLRGVAVPGIVDLIDILEDDDFIADGGFALFLQLISGEPSLVHDQVVPLLRAGNKQKCLDFIRGAEMNKLCDLLRQLIGPIAIDTFCLLLNTAQTHVLQDIFSGVDVPTLSRFFDSLSLADVQADSTLIKLLEYADEEPALINSQMVPLIKQADPTKLVLIFRMVDADRLLALLALLDSSSMLTLLDNINTKLTARLLCGPLEGVVRHVAPSLAKVMRFPAVASTVRCGSDAINLSINSAASARCNCRARAVTCAVAVHA